MKCKHNGSYGDGTGSGEEKVFLPLRGRAKYRVVCVYRWVSPVLPVVAIHLVFGWCRLKTNWLSRYPGSLGIYTEVLCVNALIALIKVWWWFVS